MHRRVLHDSRSPPTLSVLQSDPHLNVICCGHGHHGLSAWLPATKALGEMETICYELRTGVLRLCSVMSMKAYLHGVVMDSICRQGFHYAHVTVKRNRETDCTYGRRG